MPCTYDEPCEPVAQLTPLLCEAMVILERAGQLDECSKGLAGWWRKHSEAEDDKIRAEAAAKLSPRERRALSINDDGSFKTRLIKKVKR
jgi:hypothetical protein